MKRKFWWKTLVVLTLSTFAAAMAAAQTPQTLRVSRGVSGQEPNYGIESPSVSADGRWIAFSSYASNLVPDDRNGTQDVFLFDRQTQQITRPIHNLQGGEVRYGTDTPFLSRDGRYLFFVSVSNDLVPNSVNYVRKIFVLDRQTNAISRAVNGIGGVEPNNDSYLLRVSADGNWITHHSFASNLVPNDTNNRSDAFVSSRDGTQTERVSVSSAGEQANNNAYAAAISGDGRYALFNTSANNMVPNDTNGAPDAFLRDRLTQTTTRLSVADNGSQNITSYYATAMTPDARFVTLYGYGSGYLPGNPFSREYAFVRDLATQHTELVSVAVDGGLPNGNSQITGISDNGQFLAFRSMASNLVANDTNSTEDVFFRNRLTGTTACLSVDSNGVPRGGTSVLLTPDAANAVFLNTTGGLVAGDSNGMTDVFLRSPLVAQFATVSGTIALEGIAPSASPQTLIMTFRSSGQPDEIRTISVAPNGAFSIGNLPRRSYVLHISGAHYLATNAILDASAGDVSDVMATLRAGEATGDNVVDIADLLLLTAHYNQVAPAADYSAAADFNSDGINDIADLLLLIGNYNKMGDN